MPELHRLSPEDRSNLVAYLDGELDQDATQRIEQSLASNPVVRREVEMLTRTWEMLDDLPRVKASGEFTARTLELAVLEEETTPVTEQPWFHLLREGLAYLLWISCVAAVAAIAFLATNRWIPQETDPLIDDLPVIEHLDAYREVKDIDYLRRLRNSGAMNDVIQDR